MEDPPIGGVARGEECDLPPARRVWLVNRKAGKLKVGVGLRSSFLSRSPLPQESMLRRCVSLHHRPQRLFFLNLCLHTKIPTFSNRTHRLFAYKEFQQLSCALLYDLSVQDADTV